jgi:hypothetical protein
MSDAPGKTFLAYARAEKPKRPQGVVLAMYWTRVVFGVCLIALVFFIATLNGNVSRFMVMVVTGLFLIGASCAFATLVLMVCLGIRERGVAYATGNLLFAIVLTPLLGLGIFIAPTFMLMNLDETDVR